MSIEPYKLALPQKTIVSGETMGTYFSAIFFVEVGYDATHIAHKLQAAVDQVDAQMSNWKDDSDLTRFNKAAINEWVSVPNEMLFVIDEALEVGRISNGLFDISVGDLVNAWGFGPPQVAPNAADISRLTTSPRPKLTDILQLDKAQNRMRKSAPLTLDLCGIAKGYGVDRLAHVLNVAGIGNYLVSIDGEMSARGEKPAHEGFKAEPWSIAIEQPLADIREIARVIGLKNNAIATSGDYRHMREFDDKIVSHTIDKNATAPVVNQLASVSVIAPECMLADAWATALMVMGEVKAVEFANAHQMNALFILRGEAGLTEIGTGLFAQNGQD